MSLDAIPLNPFPPFILHNFIVLFHPFFRVSVVNLRATLATIEKLAHAQLTFQNLLSNDRPTKATERTSLLKTKSMAPMNRADRRMQLKFYKA